MTVTETQALKSSDRINHFLADPGERWNHRFSVKRASLVEQYRSGSMALVLHLDRSAKGIGQLNAGRFVHGVQATANDSTFVILKAHIADLHKLQHWDKHLMLVHDVENVQPPEILIPSLVGFNGFEHEVGNWDSDL